jgi:hypothetical protein
MSIFLNWEELGEVEKLIGREQFHPIIKEIYTGRTNIGGRLNLDGVLMVKMPVL